MAPEHQPGRIRETGPKLFEKDFVMFSPGAQEFDDPVPRVSDEDRAKNRKPREIELKVHTNSYAGVAKGTVIWLICETELKDAMHEICEVLGILVLEHPSDIIDYLVCEHYDSNIRNLSQLCEKPVLRYEWLIECLNTRSKAKTLHFLLS